MSGVGVDGADGSVRATVGLVGLGTMGGAMARRLLASGVDVTVWNRSAGPVEEAVALGAVAAARPEDCFAADVTISILANDASVEAVFDEATLAAARPGAVHVNMATVSLAAARRLAELHALAGVEYLAAPVLGRAQVAEAGALNIVAAGSETALERARGTLDLLGKRTWFLGERPEQANLVKIGVNFTLIHALQALAESIALVESGGVDPRLFVDVLTDAAFTGSAYTGYGPMIADRRYSPPGFTVPLGLKDLGLTEAAAAELGVALPTAPTLRSMFESALADEELARLDWSAIAEITRGMAA
ncbi:putative oxidoreductase [Cnuibacter physcomitrellae]|uniref:Uncharacterized protein n=1 Tax=Cnuibacter physcomitrellae TaxID=1619308 RepID=A0A1X9LNM7_9MICO|nr:NAD(P)-dependent oxidoreductase [Cnuibacter physcomitrellae]ARJ06727.1 hypothetical protein B5808_16975 [Cnuibacter physcomitrellae]GGI38693.1 putative oxidoreductase [Cnuibacter physcomitrellae]